MTRFVYQTSDIW